MDAILQSTCVYIVLIAIFRLTGKRTLAQITTFDFILLLIISEATQAALIGQDDSVTGAVLVILTLIGLDLGLGVWKQHSPAISKLIDGRPLILIQDGHLHRDRMERERIDEAEILQAARESRGLERLDQIKHAVLEQHGTITIIAKDGHA
jgi:uncharacterized membrane protein YcaP (DUF421 family)